MWPFYINLCIYVYKGFKATKRLELCQEIRDHELMALFNDTNVIPPPAGTLVNISSSPNGDVTSIMMPNITTCSFKEEILKVNLMSFIFAYDKFGLLLHFNFLCIFISFISIHLHYSYLGTLLIFKHLL